MHVYLRMHSSQIPRKGFFSDPPTSPINDCQVPYDHLKFSVLNSPRVHHPFVKAGHTQNFAQNFRMQLHSHIFFTTKTIRVSDISYQKKQIHPDTLWTMLLLRHLFRLVIRPSPSYERPSSCVAFGKQRSSHGLQSNAWGLWLLYTWMFNWNQKRGAYIYTLYTVYIYTDVYITSFWNVLSMPGKWEHIFRRIWRFFFSSFGVNTFGCAIEVVAGSQFAAPLVEVLFRFRPCRWWKMPNQKTAFWRILNGQRWSQRESSTWQEWRIHAWALFMSRLKAFVLKYTSRIIIQQIYRYWNMK